MSFTECFQIVFEVFLQKITLMNVIEKWNTIVNWQQHNLSIEVEDEKFDKELNKPITPEEITVIEQLSEETLQEVFKVFYSNGNGQPEKSYPLFFGETFISSNEIIRDLEYAKSLVRPEIQKVNNPQESQFILDKIVKSCINDIPNNDSWFKIKFSCSENSIEGPELYKSEEAGDHDKEFFEVSDFDFFLNLVSELHKLEYESYNWDELEFVVYFDGKFEVKRKNYDFDNEILFTSTPENTIKKKYSNHKWIPIFSDHGGNYIGIDLDPDVQGKKGQIINFGRDEEDKFVIADDLEQFFDFIINELAKNEGESFRSGKHLHDVIRELKNGL